MAPLQHTLPASAAYACLHIPTWEGKVHSGVFGSGITSDWLETLSFQEQIIFSKVCFILLYQGTFYTTITAQPPLRCGYNDCLFMSGGIDLNKSNLVLSASGSFVDLWYQDAVLAIYMMADTNVYGRK